MPVQNQIPVKTYVGNASTTVFPYPFKVISEESLKVFINETLQPSGYLVSGVGNNAGGNVTFSVAPPLDAAVRLERVTPLERNTDYIEGGALPADVLDADQDAPILMLQEQAAKALYAYGGEYIDARGRRIGNMADPVEDTDAATKGWIYAEENTIVAQADAHRVAAEMARDVAEEQAESAMDSAMAANGAMVGAAGFRELAEDFADAAQASADAAQVSADAAQASADAAFTSESNAAAAKDAADVAAANAASSESTAASHASNAGTSAGNAATSETNAAASAAAAAASHLAVTSTVANFTGRNKIINGKMEIGQRGTNFPALAGAYSLDRWSLNGILGTSVSTVSQQADSPNAQFKNSLRLAVTTADTSIAAGEVAMLSQIIEGYNIHDLVGQTFTISFWVRSSKTGVHCVAMRNAGPDRSYVAEYNVTVANTWQYKTITVTGGLTTAGTWNFTNGAGLNFHFCLAAGTTYRTTAGAWQTGNFMGTANQVNCLDTIGNIFAITGVQLEVGTVASPFEHRPYSTEYALCQRYYETSEGAGILWSGNTFSTAVYYHTNYYKVTKRAAPTVVCAAAAQNGFPAGSPSISAPLTGSFNAVHQANATLNGGYFQYGWTSNAEL